MNLGRLVSEVKDIIQDTTYSDADIITRINEAVYDIAAGLEIPGKWNITGPLPDLFTSDTVSLVNTSRSADLPSDYQRGPVSVYSTTSSSVIMMTSFQRFMKDYPTLETGSYIDYAIIHGGSLFVQPAVTDTVTVSYYKVPDTLSEDTDEPTAIPTQFHRRLIVGMVCRDIFNRIEDGLEGQKPNTRYYQDQVDKAIYALDLYLGDDGSPNYIEDNDTETEIVE